MVTPPDGDAAADADVPVRLDCRTRLPFRDMNGGDDAAIVYHEYTHGLSNRLVTDADGVGRAQRAAGRRDGRGVERLVRDGLPRRARASSSTTRRAGEVDIGDYTDAAPHSIRIEALDCPVGAAAPPALPRRHGTGGRAATRTATSATSRARRRSTPTARSGAQTLWDLRSGWSPRRRAAGSDLAEQLITEGMRLSPPEPSFLDMRNAILAADVGDRGGANRDLHLVACSPRAAWATSPRAATRATRRRWRTSTRRPARARPTGTIAGTVTDGRHRAAARRRRASASAATPPTRRSPTRSPSTSGADGTYTLDAPAAATATLTISAAAGSTPCQADDVVVPGGRHRAARRRDPARLGGEQAAAPRSSDDETTTAAPPSAAAPTS